MSSYFKATEVDEFLNKVGKGNCNLCAFYDECNPRGLNGKGSHRYCWQLMRFPTADVVEVVRCKDCIYFQDNNSGYPHNECKWCKDETPNADDFCSYGERKDENA